MEPCGSGQSGMGSGLIKTARSRAFYELPVSYWRDGNQWINSPGYRDGTANFARHVDPRCLECHATYSKALSTDPQTNLFDKASFVPGISCESCHGAGARHVAIEKDRPASGKSLHDQAIINPASFTRDRKVDQPYVITEHSATD